MKTVIIGYGYLGRWVARGLPPKGGDLEGERKVNVLCRTTPDDPNLHHIQADLDNPATLQNIDVEGALIYYFAPPPSSGQIDSRIGNFLAAIAEQQPERIVLVSTTGVYGDCHGDWVDESRPAKPQVDRAHRRWDAEQQLNHWAAERDITAVVLRVPGIYGPGKLPIKRVESGEPILDPAQSPYSNRVHIDDLASACIAAGRHPDPKPLYNICDGHPSTMSDYFLQLAGALGLPSPPLLSREQAEKQLSAGMRSYLAESKRIGNALMRQHLGVALKYPTLSEGLKASL